MTESFFPITDTVGAGRSLASHSRLFEAQRRVVSAWIRAWVHGWRFTVRVLSSLSPVRPPTEDESQAFEQLEEFAGVVAHDLRNPLTTARGRLELAQESLNQDSEDRTHLAALDDALTRLEERIAELETLARDGRTVEEREPVDLAAVAQASWQGAGTADADLVVAATGTLTADEIQLRLLFENLFQNAVVHGGPTVTVRVGMLDDGFYVADDGPGIPPAARERVFQQGYSTGAGGTGYGLHIVKEIVEAHDWEITITESTEGGARFEIRGVE